MVLFPEPTTSVAKNDGKIKNLVYLGFTAQVKEKTQDSI